MASLTRPGGNITGLTHFETSMAGKWLETLKALAAPIRQSKVGRGRPGQYPNICLEFPLHGDQIALMQNDNVASSQFPGLRELGVEPTRVDAVLDEVGRRAAASG